MTKIIDCTLRDGGYLNGWNFETNFVKELYKTANSSGVQYLEVGYRNNQKTDKQALFAVCDDDFLFKTFCEYSNTKIAVMADVGKSNLKLFKQCTSNNTIVSLVRVAVYPDKLTEAFDFCEGLKDKNYDVMLNLMALGKYNSNDIMTLEKWKNKDILTSVCFADSFGAMYPDDINKYFNLLREIGYSNISFHAHNNLQLAFANSICAVNNNFYSVDAAVCGVGRSGGILPIELITGSKIFKGKYNVLPYLEFINKFMSSNQNIKAVISGLKNIHPNYVKELFDKYDGDIKLIWEKAQEIEQSRLISYVK